LLARRFGSQFFDLWLGVVTTDEMAARELGLDCTEYLKIHRALPFMGVWRLLRRLDPAPSDGLLDIGCGVGRVICVAAQYPLYRVVGIDIDERCCALAERNVHNLRSCTIRPEVICMDASVYKVPDDITIIFFYNSFRGDQLRSMLGNVIESYDRAPRRIRLIYANPREHDLIISTERFRETSRFWISWRPGAEWGRTQMMRFYEVEPRRAHQPVEPIGDRHPLLSGTAGFSPSAKS